MERCTWGQCCPWYLSPHTHIISTPYFQTCIPQCTSIHCYNLHYKICFPFISTNHLFCDLETTPVLPPVVLNVFNKILLSIYSPTTKTPHLNGRQLWDYQNIDSLQCLRLEKVEHTWITCLFSLDTAHPSSYIFSNR